MVERLKNFCDRLPLSNGALFLLFTALAFLVRIPFLFRYDLYFGADMGVCYLMPIRILQGDRPFYFYASDHQGSLESYLTAILFKVFGPSIPLGGAFTLAEWSLSVGIGVYLVTRGTTKFYGIIGGLFAVVSVPYTLRYVTLPYLGYPGSLLITMLILLEAYFILEKGSSLIRFFLLGLTIGTGMWVGKQCLPGAVAAFVAMGYFQTTVWNRRQLSRFPPWTAMACGFGIGYFPEIWYRWHNPVYRSMSGIASLSGMWGNFKEVRKALYAYFDAHPFSRIPENIYFYHSIPFDLVHPSSPGDYLCVVLALVVTAFTAIVCKRAFQDNNPTLFLLTALIWVNILAVIVSRESIQNIFNVRRYLHSSAVVLSLFTGYFFAYGAQRLETRKKGKWAWSLALLGFMFLGWSSYHHYALLQAPDELRDIRWLIQGMQAQGIDRGIAPFGPDYVVNGLTEEKILLATEVGDDKVPEYADKVAQAKRIAVIHYTDEPLRKSVSFKGKTYRLKGSIQSQGIIQWGAYKKEGSS